MPKVYNKHHKNAPVDGVYVGRPSKWGNPFSHQNNTLAQFKVKDRTEAVAKYREWVMHPDRAILYYKIREELANKDLVCWCAPKPCHADILLEIANAE